MTALHKRAIYCVVACIALLSLVNAWKAHASQSSAAVVQKPKDCVDVSPAQPLQELIANTPEGSALCLGPGIYHGPLRLDRSVHLWGSADAKVMSSGVGTTIEVLASDVSVTGITIDGSGSRYDTDDAALKIHGDRVRVQNVLIEHAVFGILLSQSANVVLRNNRIHGNPSLPTGLRGDSIRLWETRDSLVEGNRAESGRDVVLWYSSGNQFRGNYVSDGRYGAHFMYSHNNVIENNVFERNVVGTFVMYSHDVTLRNNDYRDMFTPAAMGIGLKESENIRVENNRFFHCTSGLYIDTSPLSYGSRDDIENNRFVLSDRAVEFLGRSEGNFFSDNTFVANRRNVASDGGGDALASVWRNNYFDNYVGYDLNRDGIGDVAHEERSLSLELSEKVPSLEFFRGMPALLVVEVIGRIVPLFRPKTMFSDPQPRTSSDAH